MATNTTQQHRLRRKQTRSLICNKNIRIFNETLNHKVTSHLTDMKKFISEHMQTQLILKEKLQLIPSVTTRGSLRTTSVTRTLAWEPLT